MVRIGLWADVYDRPLRATRITDNTVLKMLDNWNEGANHVNGAAGAFFTPTGFARDFAIDACGGRTIDLCAGIGALAFHVYWRAHYVRGDNEPQNEIVCIEHNPSYVEVDRKVLPEAKWICADVFNLDFASLGHFGCAIANPPFGATPRSGAGPRYTGRSFEFHLIDIASDIADYGAFIIPQTSAPFQYSGVQCFRERKNADYLRFAEQTGIQLEAGCGVDCAYYRDEWKGVAPNVEIVLCQLRRYTPQQISHDGRSGRGAARPVEQEGRLRRAPGRAYR